MQAEQERLRLADLRYRNGVASYLDLLDAQRSLFALEQADVQVRLTQLLNQINLYKALGGGWSEASLGSAAASAAAASLGASTAASAATLLALSPAAVAAAAPAPAV